MTLRRSLSQKNSYNSKKMQRILHKIKHQGTSNSCNIIRSFCNFRVMNISTWNMTAAPWNGVYSLLKAFYDCENEFSWLKNSQRDRNGGRRNDIACNSIMKNREELIKKMPEKYGLHSRPQDPLFINYLIQPQDWRSIFFYYSSILQSTNRIFSVVTFLSKQNCNYS